MKLETRKVMFVGLAFFIITIFWQTYDNIIAKILIDTYGLNQTLSGVVMALDNILALMLLPVFGYLSDKTKTRLGKRTPYIIIGTLVGAFAFMALALPARAQREVLLNETDIEARYQTLLEAQETNTPIAWEHFYLAMRSERQATGGEALATFEASVRVLFDAHLYDQGVLRSTLTADNTEQLVEGGYRYLNQRAFELTQTSPGSFIAFLAVLFVALIAMSFFRSPAVALMPDVTIKPLRSKANAIINLLGTFGGIIAIVVLTVFSLEQFSYVDYTPAFLTIGALMIVLLIVFLWKVRENDLVKEREDLEARLGLVEEETSETVTALDKEKKIALILILASIFLWFFGYNAITTKLSDYAPKVLNIGFTIPLLVAQGAALLAFVPIGLIATKVGRKKTVLVGVVMLTVSFASISFFSGPSPLIYVIFALTGISWATINVNSFPMVVELAKGSDVGKYTGYYYTFSMAAQIFTPVLSGFLMDQYGRTILFPYAATFAGLSFVTMWFVKHGDSVVLKKDSLLENFDVDMD